jgi:hypothetical protein
MTPNITALVTPDGNSDNSQCYCNRCHRVWTLDRRQGVCPWCNKPASCITATSKPRHIKSRSNRRNRQAPVRSNGYDQLDGQWLAYYKVASGFTSRVKFQDKEDILHTIMVTLADVEWNNGHEPFTEAVMYRIASRTVADYWRSYYKANNGLECGSCSKAQRQKCKEDKLYAECPKAIKLESLNKPITDNEGNLTELGNLISDDRALDLDAWADAKTFLLSFPHRLMEIAHKLYNGDNLIDKDRQYLSRFRRREQRKFSLDVTFKPQIPTTIVEASSRLASRS